MSLITVAEAILDEAAEEYRDENLASRESVARYADSINIQLSDYHAEAVLVVCKLCREKDYKSGTRDYEEYVTEPLDDMNVESEEYVMRYLQHEKYAKYRSKDIIEKESEEHEEYLKSAAKEAERIAEEEALPEWQRYYDEDQRLFAVANLMLDEANEGRPESLSEFVWNIKDVEDYADAREVFLEEGEAKKILEACRNWIALEDEGEATGNLWYHTVEAPLTDGLTEEEA